MRCYLDLIMGGKTKKAGLTLHAASFENSDAHLLSAISLFYVLSTSVKNLKKYVKKSLLVAIYYYVSALR